jgi:hypothetical protein
MSKLISTSLAALSLAALCTAATAQNLPKSGTINIHTGWRASGDTVTVAENHMQGHGTVSGSAFNENGSGPLHLGPANCFYSFFLVDGSSKAKGYCAFGDRDGDRLFTDWEGIDGAGGAKGINTIIGGTGKYAGIKGSGQYNCEPGSANGEMACKQTFNYRLP